MRHDALADLLSALKNGEEVGKSEVVVPASGVIKNVLKIMQEQDYIGNFEFIDDGKAGKFSVELIGRINKAKAVRPRFPVKKDEYEKWETRYLPGEGIGVLIVSTPKGVMTQKQAEKKETGGRLLAYVY